MSGVKMDTESSGDAIVGLKGFKATTRDNPGNTRSTRLRHFVIIACQICITAHVIWLNLRFTRDPEEQYRLQADIILILVSIVLCLSLPFAIANSLGLILYNPFVLPRITDSLYSAPFICFRMVTRGDCPNFVIDNAIANKETCVASGLKNFVIEIVTDKAVNAPKDAFIREIVVPNEYTTANGTMFKARALNYCLEANVHILSGNEWIVHLDEESILQEETIQGIIEFIHDNKADIGQGAINYAAGHVISNWFTTLIDCTRLGMDYAVFRFTLTFLKAPVFGFKGSYIVIKQSVEMDVGFDFGPKGSIAEDCWFALKAWNTGYVFGFVKGELREKSPFTVMDFIRQRRRWFMGLFYIAFSSDIPLFYRSGVALGVICSMLMPISLFNLYPFGKPFLLSVSIGLIVGSFSTVNMFGTYKSFSRRRWGIVSIIIISLFNCIVLLPISALLECYANIWGLLTMNTREFFVIKKEVTRQKCNKV